ncbi:MAG: hypothetical protein ABI868_21845 [Acidobacteriota bacterium]
MATCYSQPVPLNRTSNPTTGLGDRHDGVVGRMVARSREFWCGLRGHDNLMHFEKERLFMECVSCGHESPGWALTQAPPKVVIRGDARRHALVRPQMISERRVA